VTWLDDCRIPNQDNENADRLPANLLVSDQALSRASKFFNLDLWEDVQLPFILSPKASRKERDAGLEESVDKDKGGKNQSSKLRPEARKNPHPTVKPLKLMFYLITMASREGDIVFDPFCGIGTTCIAAMMLKRDYVGIEVSKEYHGIPIIFSSNRL
jgi:DNA modification methylase